jgi:DNA-binding transcriptional regulator YiaG
MLAGLFYGITGMAILFFVFKALKKYIYKVTMEIAKNEIKTLLNSRIFTDRVITIIRNESRDGVISNAFKYSIWEKEQEWIKRSTNYQLNVPLIEVKNEHKGNIQMKDYKNDSLIAKNLVALRNKKNLSQIELAKLAGIGKNTLQGYESGRRFPSQEYALKIVAALDCELIDLVDDNIKQEFMIDNQLQYTPYHKENYKSL